MKTRKKLFFFSLFTFLNVQIVCSQKLPLYIIPFFYPFTLSLLFVYKLWSQHDCSEWKSIYSTAKSKTGSHQTAINYWDQKWKSEEKNIYKCKKQLAPHVWVTHGWLKIAWRMKNHFWVTKTTKDFFYTEKVIMNFHSKWLFFFNNLHIYFSKKYFFTFQKNEWNIKFCFLKNTRVEAKIYVKYL